MSNFHTLTKRVDHQEFISELLVAGVSAGIAIDHEKVILNGAAWENMDAAAQTAELALVASTDAAHTPTTITEVTLTAAPHVRTFLEECLAVTGVTNVTVELPETYSGTATLIHNSLSTVEQTNLASAATSHDASSVPSLSVDTVAQVIAADNTATGTVTVTDSRGAAANGNTVKLLIPPGGSAAVDGDSFTLSGAGQATATFGATTTFTGVLPFEWYYSDGSVDPVSFTIRRGTA